MSEPWIVNGREITHIDPSDARSAPDDELTPTALYVRYMQARRKQMASRWRMRGSRWLRRAAGRRWIVWPLRRLLLLYADVLVRPPILPPPYH